MGAGKTPGPLNQKSVAGPLQRVATLPVPPAICSASKPRAIDPPAWMTTPPCAGTVVTGWLLGTGEGLFVLAGDGLFVPVVLVCAGAGMLRTPVSDRTPGWVRLSNGVPGGPPE